MAEQLTVAAEPTAVRVALWRALHIELDAPPHIIRDQIGLRLADPAAGWRERPDMHPQGTRLFRASIVARARFIEDLVAEKVPLTASTNTCCSEPASTPSRSASLEVGFAPARVRSRSTRPQEWKRRRLVELGFGVPEWLRLVPIDFEAGASWRERLTAAGFTAGKPAVVKTSTTA